MKIYIEAKDLMQALRLNSARISHVTSFITREMCTHDCYRSKLKLTPLARRASVTC